MSTLIQLRRDTAANWASNNPTLALGEQAFETDTNLMKIGDGTTAFNDLPYFANSGVLDSPNFDSNGGAINNDPMYTIYVGALVNRMDWATDTNTTQQVWDQSFTNGTELAAFLNGVSSPYPIWVFLEDGGATVEFDGVEISNVNAALVFASQSYEKSTPAVDTVCNIDQAGTNTVFANIGELYFAGDTAWSDDISLEGVSTVDFNDFYAGYADPTFFALACDQCAYVSASACSGTDFSAYACQVVYTPTVSRDLATFETSSVYVQGNIGRDLTIEHSQYVSVTGGIIVTGNANFTNVSVLSTGNLTVNGLSGLRISGAALDVQGTLTIDDSIGLTSSYGYIGGVDIGANSFMYNCGAISIETLTVTLGSGIGLGWSGDYVTAAGNNLRHVADDGSVLVLGNAPTSTVFMTLPTTDPANGSGALWSNAGVLTISS